jgi:hypothetical protein
LAQLELHWIRDADGTVLRYAEITDWNACEATPDHTPRTWILRLSDGKPVGRMAPQGCDWPDFRRALRAIQPHEVFELIVGIPEANAEMSGGR